MPINEGIVERYYQKRAILRLEPRPDQVAEWQRDYVPTGLGLGVVVRVGFIPA